MPSRRSSVRRKPSARRKSSRTSSGFISLFSKLTGRSATSRTSSGSGGLLTPASKLSRGQMTLVMGLVAFIGIVVVVVSFAGNSSYGLWSDKDRPAEIASWDSQATELGVRFTTATAGSVTGVRFYKGSGNTGTHIGRLWDSQGRQLAGATFVGETSSGWQTVTFPKTIAIKANQEYVVSYYAPKGHYGITTDYFRGRSKTTKDLTAPASTRTKKNGVSKYGSGFPTGSYRSSNYWVDVMFQPATIINPTPKPTTTPTLTPGPTGTPSPTATPKPTTTPSTTPKPTPTPTPTPTPAPGNVTLATPAKKEIAMELVSSAENSSLDWRAQYGYIEDIGDGRGYTGGIIGFCSGTSDMLELVKYYNTLVPNNVLQKYTAALQKIDDAGGGSSHAGLDPNFTKDWKTAAADTKFQQAQDYERDLLYFNPALKQALADGVPVLGQFAYYDAAVVHGVDGMMSVRAAAMKNAKTPAQGGNVTTYLSAFLDARDVEMRKEAAHSDTTRIDTAQRVFLNAGNLNLDPPLNWKVYGDSYSIPR